MIDPRFAAQSNCNLVLVDGRGVEHLEGLLEICKSWLEIIVPQQVADECGVFAAAVARAPCVMECPAVDQLVWKLHVRVHLREPYFDP